MSVILRAIPGEKSTVSLPACHVFPSRNQCGGKKYWTGVALLARIPLSCESSAQRAVTRSRHAETARVHTGGACGLGRSSDLSRPRALGSPPRCRCQRSVV